MDRGCRLPAAGRSGGLLSSCRPIRLSVLFHCLAQGPERRGGPCPPRCYGNVGDGASEGTGVGVGDGLGDGDGRGRFVGDGDGDGVGVGDGSAVALGDGSGLALGDVEGVALGSAETAGLADGSGVGEGLTAGLAVGAGVTTTAGGVSLTEGAADTTGWAMLGASVGVMLGPTVARGGGTGCVSSAAARTAAPPSNPTVTMATTSVPVVRTAPRKTCVWRSWSHER